MTHAEARGRFIEVLRAEGATEYAARIVLRNAATLDRLAVVACSYERSEAQEARDTRTEERCEARIKEILEPSGIVPVFSGDPRGCVVRLKLKSGRYDNWDGEHYGVPVRES